jgi:hypothetical protein
LDVGAVNDLEAALRAAGEGDRLDAARRRTSELVTLSDVRPKPIEFLWWPRIPVGQLTIFDGDPGLGKSTLTTDLAARVSTGAPWPDGVAGDVPGDVVLISGEDDLESVVLPRLLAAGGDPARVHAYRGPIDENGHSRPPTVPEDVDRIAAALGAVARPRHLVIDPNVAFLGDRIDAHSDKSVRKALRALRDLAEASGVAVVVVRHLNKSGGTNATYRGGGSIGFIGAARSGLMVATDPGEEGEDARLTLAHYKSNVARKASSLTYDLVEADLGGGVVVARVEWTGTSDRSASELLGVPERGRRPVKIDEAEAWLRGQLFDGEWRLKEEVLAAAAALTPPIAARTLERAFALVGIAESKYDPERGAPLAWWRLRRADERGSSPY